MSSRCLCSEDELRALLRYERARSDRTHQNLCLVVFRPLTQSTQASAWPLARTVLTRARATDVVGWFDARAIAALLPDTAVGGARRFADNVCEAVEKLTHRPGCEIYAYPEKQFAVSEGWNLDRSAEERSAVAKDPTILAINPSLHVPVAPGPQSHAMPAGERRGAAGTPSSADTAPVFRPLEPLLVRSMPCWKRAIDVVAASMALVVLAPLMALIALVIKLSSPGPVIFRQVRSGVGGKPFMMCKFRTMVADAEARKRELLGHNEQDGPAFKMKSDPRVTPLGRFLRQTSLDELPQLWNVLKGEMTLVGPRPLPVDETDNCRPWHRRRLEVTPGLTCIWQIDGRNRVTFDEWVRMDVSYINQRTIFHDAKLLIQTVPAALWKKSGM